MQSEDTSCGIYGWRKRCLYGIIVALVLVIPCNLVATLVLVNLINFNLGGLGELRISPGGVFVKDQTFVMDSLVTSRISSREGRPLNIESSYNMTLDVRDENGLPLQSLHFWSPTHEPRIHEVFAEATKFRVSDLSGKMLLSAEEGRVDVGTENLKIMGGGAHFSGSVQTSMLRSNLGSELMLESTTRSLLLSAPGGVSIESRAADISASCLTDLHLSSSNGKVKMKAPGIFIPNLESIPLLQPQPSRYFQMQHETPSKTYQMCMCSNGKLFVAPPNGECSVNNDGFQCR